MAYQFNGTNQYLISGQTINVLPFTVACMVNAPANTLAAVIAFGNGGTSTNRVILGLDTNKSFVQIGGSFGVSTNTYSANTWTHIAGVFNTSSAEPWLNGVGGAPISTSGFQTISETIIAARRNNSIGAYLGGLIAEVGIWTAALTANEVASLAKGMTCDKIRPQSLVFYAPLVRNLQDTKGGLTITNNNDATVANHPRVYA